MFVKNLEAPTGRYRAIPVAAILERPEVKALGKAWLRDVTVVASVFPSRINQHVVTKLINWNSLPADPIFQTVVPQPDMLKDDDKRRMRAALDSGDSLLVQRTAASIRRSLNPHPGDQQSNTAILASGSTVPGVQHKYTETLLLFPGHGQTCHAYCTFCFRFAQFTGPHDGEPYFATNDYVSVVRYVNENPLITDLLITGGDPMVMATTTLERLLEPFIARRSNLQTIRFGTRALSFWPRRFTTDSDAGCLLSLFERLRVKGFEVALMAHLGHPIELGNSDAEEAIRLLRSAGVTIRSQSPVLRHVNDEYTVWSELWSRQISLGIIPYYMFIERDTGADHYFSLPLIEAWRIYTRAKRSLSGLARTVRGPCMSTSDGKIEILGPCSLGNEELLALRYIQARDASRVNKPFFARCNDSAVWFDQLELLETPFAE